VIGARHNVPKRLPRAPQRFHAQRKIEIFGGHERLIKAAHRLEIGTADPE